ncbi:alpha/beta hydrolase [Lysobacter yangpyeongensis]|uniref:Alpha/beta hydrolase n=1 Tax=Lysobacter yangpyeongensis TaxID=346182 RepID=A0ABW0SJ52_9GAMM
MFWIALPLTMAYLGLCGFMYVRQRDLVYCPQDTRVEATQTNFSLVNGDVTLRGWVVNPGRKRALVYFGGNSEPIQGNRGSFARWFPEHTVYLVSYRGFGASEGQPDEASLASDALLLFDHVRRLHPRVGIDVIGYSLGSGVAAHVAAQRRVRRLALITPYDTLVDVGQAHYRWLPIHLLARDRFDSVSNLSRRTGPTLVVRAGRDRVIPAASTQRLIDALPRRPQVLELPTAEHGNVARAPGFVRTLRAFFGAHTRRTRTVATRRSRRPNPYPLRRKPT